MSRLKYVPELIVFMVVNTEIMGFFVKICLVIKSSEICFYFSFPFIKKKTISDN